MSTVKAAGWKDLSGRTIQTPAQIVSAQKTDTWYCSATVWTDIPGLSVTIKPFNSRSVVLVLVSVQLSGHEHGGIRLVRNDVPIGSGEARGSNRTAAFDWNYGYTGANTSGYPRRQKGGHWLDSPATTSECVYTVQYSNPYSTGYYAGVNYNAYDNQDLNWNARCVSTIHAIEIQQ